MRKIRLAQLGEIIQQGGLGSIIRRDQLQQPLPPATQIGDELIEFGRHALPPASGFGRVMCGQPVGSTICGSILTQQGPVRAGQQTASVPIDLVRGGRFA